MIGFQGCEDMEDIERRLRTFALLFHACYGHKFEYKGGEDEVVR